MNDGLVGELEDLGRVWFRAALDADDLAAFEHAARNVAGPGTRLDQDRDLQQALGPDSAVTGALQHIQPGTRAVRVVMFNKSGRTNWAVPWHQDRIIAVAERHAVDGFANWSHKTGIWHCEPPVALLDRMLFVRVHLDNANAGNGAMEIALGSHRLGRVTTDEAEQAALSCKREICLAQRGDVQVLKMGILHRSRPSRTTAPRRAIRIDFCADNLPPPLLWSI